MNKRLREKVKMMFGGKCAYCGCDLGGRWHVDHVESVKRDSRYDRVQKKYVMTGTCERPENDREDNYFPACASCNITKSAASVEDFRRYIQSTVDLLNKNHYAAYRFAKRYGLLQETPKPVVFWFEIFQPDTLL